MKLGKGVVSEAVTDKTNKFIEDLSSKKNKLTFMVATGGGGSLFLQRLTTTQVTFLVQSVAVMTPVLLDGRFRDPFRVFFMPYNYSSDCTQKIFRGLTSNA